MGNYFSSSKSESIQIINETDHVHVIVTNSGEPMEKKDEHVTKIEESMLKEVKENDGGVLNEDEGQVENGDCDDTLTMDANGKVNSNCIHYVIQKRNLKKKNKKKNKKKHHLQ